MRTRDDGVSSECARQLEHVETGPLTMAQLLGIADFTQLDDHAWLSPMVGDPVALRSHLIRSHVEDFGRESGPVLWMADRGHLRQVHHKRRSSWLYVILLVALAAAAIIRDRWTARQHDAEVARLNALAETEERMPRGGIMPREEPPPSALTKTKKIKVR